MSPSQAQTTITNASTALVDYCQQWGLYTTITGVSGGLDSAVVLALSMKATELAKKRGFELKTLGLILPCHSDPEHTRLGKKVIQTFGAELLEIDLTNIFDVIQKNVLEPVSGTLSAFYPHNPYNPHVPHHHTALGNLKARLRMALGTYYVANVVNGLVLSTDNLSEYLMGFWTLHGDVGDFGMIQNLWKGDEIPMIAKVLGIPNEVIDAVPTDGLGVHPGGDEAQMGAPYSVVDSVLKQAMEEGIDLDGSLDQLSKLPKILGVTETTVRKILERSLKNSFKRRHPKNLSRKILV